MRAMRFDSFGDSSVLALRDIPRPVPAAGELLIRLNSTSVNPVDIMIRGGGYPRVTAASLPYVGGRDAAGHVEAVGEGVDDSWRGARVFGLPEMDRGTYADYTILKLSQLSRAPDNMPIEDLGCVPLAALTAWQALHDQGEIASGQRVLIHGGSGGVGHFAVQIAKAAGAKVYATASSRNTGFLRELGADTAIAYDRENFEEIANDIDLVFDTVGGKTLQRSVAVVKPGGAIVSAVAAPDLSAARQVGLRKALFFIAESRGDQLSEVARMIDAGMLRVVIGRRFPLAELAQAQDLLTTGGTCGKIGVSIS